jgi:hypothetical protein
MMSAQRTWSIEKHGQWYQLMFHDPAVWPDRGMVIRSRAKAPMAILKTAFENRRITREEFRKYVEFKAKEWSRSLNKPLPEARVEVAKYAVIDMQNFGLPAPEGIAEEYGRIFAGVAKPAAKVKLRYSGSKIVGGRVVRG